MPEPGRTSAQGNELISQVPSLQILQYRLKVKEEEGIGEAADGDEHVARDVSPSSLKAVAAQELLGTHYFVGGKGDNHQMREGKPEVAYVARWVEEKDAPGSRGGRHQRAVRLLHPGDGA
jgi:hypothetical protein